MAFAVDPSHLHARSQGTHAVQVRVIADVQHLMRRNACGLGPRYKNAHIGLGHAQRFGTDRCMKVFTDAYPVHIGVWLDIDGGGVLHAVRHAGVVFQNLAALDAHGWRIEGFYRFRELR